MKRTDGKAAGDECIFDDLHGRGLELADEAGFDAIPDTAGGEPVHWDR